jgi:hypothetical protein
LKSSDTDDAAVEREPEMVPALGALSGMEKQRGSEEGAGVVEPLGGGREEVYGNRIYACCFWVFSGMGRRKAYSVFSISYQFLSFYVEKEHTNILPSPTTPRNRFRTCLRPRIQKLLRKTKRIFLPLRYQKTYFFHC